MQTQTQGIAQRIIASAKSQALDVTRGLNWDHALNPTSVEDMAANIIDMMVANEPYLLHYGYLGFQRDDADTLSFWQLPHPWLNLHLSHEERQRPELILVIRGVASGHLVEEPQSWSLPISDDELADLGRHFADLLH